MRPNCVTATSPRHCSAGVAFRLYTFFQSVYSARGTPCFPIQARNTPAAAQIVSSLPRGAAESKQAAEASAPSAEFNQAEIFRFGGGTIWTDLSGRALGRGRRHRDGSRDFAPLDVGRTALEPAAEAQETLPTKGAQIALR